MQALLIAHGQPSDPAPQEAAMADLAARVQALLPGWKIRGATLAAPGALEAALARLDRPLIFPFFMAEGWFTRTLLPRRLAEAGAGHLTPLPAFGATPELPALTARAALEGAKAAGLDPASTTLLLAAHGSRVARASAEGAEAMADHLRRTTPFTVATGFIEEAPFLQDAARGLDPALCLPFFALRASHVAEDIPRALATAGFAGPLLPPLGEHPEVPALIAAALRRG